jgi:addiction module HigA family antidote
MSIANSDIRKVPPIHPGEFLREGFIPDYGLSVNSLAKALGVSRRALTAEMALRLAKLFGNSPDFWMNAQKAVDLWKAAAALGPEMDRIKPLGVA